MTARLRELLARHPDLEVRARRTAPVASALYGESWTCPTCACRWDASEYFAPEQADALLEVVLEAIGREGGGR